MSRTIRKRYRDEELPNLYVRPNSNPRRARFNADRQSEIPSDIGTARSKVRPRPAP
jgi:hypothetical protein